MPPKRGENKDITKECNNYEEIGKEYQVIREETVKILKKIKKTQKEYLDLVKKHQNYWNSELEKSEYENTGKRRKLKETLKKEEEILEKLEKELQRTDERIEFHKKHVH